MAGGGRVWDYAILPALPHVGRRGTWELALPPTEEVAGRFRRSEIEDVLLVISYEGQLPAWPK